MDHSFPRPGTADERLLTPGEVAAIFRVDPKTVTRWAASGRLTSIRTPGGHRRFKESEVRKLLRTTGSQEAIQLSSLPVFMLRRPERSC